jgi:bifunctional non-homologous end joining protein LigD
VTNGIEESGYFTKAVPDHFPAWVDRVTVPKRGGTVTHRSA